MTDAAESETELTEKEKAQLRNARIGEFVARRRSIPSGDIVDRYRMVSNRRKIVLGLLLAFVIRILATMDAEGAKKGKSKVKEALKEQNLIAWAVLASFLAIASDIESTSDIAVAFTVLILIAAILSSGPDALDNLDKLVKGGKQIQKQAGKPKPA
jgi:hypothetical protein